jgi:MFS family permease
MTTTSTLGGRMADRVPRGPVVAISWSAFALALALFAVFPGRQALWLITVTYGLFACFGEGAERAAISDFATEQERATAFGWYTRHYQGVAAALLIARGLALVSVALLRV